MITVILMIGICIVCTRLMIKLFVDGADDYSQGVSSFKAFFFKSVGFAILDTGAAGALAVSGLILYGLNMIAKAANPSAYERYALLKILAVIAGVCFLLAIVLAIFKSLRCMCDVGLLLVVGIVLLEYFNIFAMNLIGVVQNVFMWLMVAFALLVYIIGPTMMLLYAFFYWLFGTLFGLGRIFFVIFLAIAVFIMPFFTHSEQHVVLGIGAVDWRFLAIVLVFTGISFLLEKRPERSDE